MHCLKKEEKETNEWPFFSKLGFEEVVKKLGIKFSKRKKGQKK